MFKNAKMPVFAIFLTIAFLNAFVDLGHKIIIQNTIFKIYDGNTQVILTAIVNAMILLPFVVLFSPSSFIADKFSKYKVMRYSAAMAILLSLLIVFSYYRGWFVFSFILTLLLAMQSAIYSPAKYGYIRELLGIEELSFGNSWVQAISMIAILSGTVVFSFLFELYFNLAPIKPQTCQQVLLSISPLGWFLVMASIFEFILTYFLIPKKAANAQLNFEYKKYFRGKMSADNLAIVKNRKPIMQAIIGIAIFWMLAQVILAVFPAYVEQKFSEKNTFVIQISLACSGIGVLIGAYLSAAISKKRINLTPIPISALIIAIAICSLLIIKNTMQASVIFFFIGLFGAIMTIPMQAVIQFEAPQQNIGNILAARNFIENIIILIGLAVVIFFSLVKFSAYLLLIILAIVSLLGALYTIIVLPHAFAKIALFILSSGNYRLNVQGFDHLPTGKHGVLLLGNHISWLDWAFIQMAYPRGVRFVMERSIYERWYWRSLLRLFAIIPISSNAAKNSLSEVKKALQRGEVVCLFPEGAISHTGQLGEFKKGFEQAIEGTNALIVPFYLRGLWGSRFSHARQKLQINRRYQLKRDVIIAFGKPLPTNSNSSIVKQHIFALSISTWNEHTNSLPTIDRAFIDSYCKNKNNHWAVVDSTDKPISYSKLLTATLMLRKLISSNKKAMTIGILLPTSSAAMIANLATLMSGKIAVNLNYTSSIENLQNAKEEANIKIIITAEKFLLKLKNRGIDVDKITANTKVIDLQIWAQKNFILKKMFYFIITKLMPAFLLKFIFCSNKHLDDTAAILFSSGSEGKPKGILLTHRNIIANSKQIADMINFHQDEVVLASLPLFHAFGLTVTCFMPIIEGISTVCHPDPTDAVGVARAVAKYRATLLWGTSTFLRLYAKNNKVYPMMFASLRIVVAGAEKLNNETRQLFENKFHKQILEGYGTTETTPVVAVNIPDYLDTRFWQIQKGYRAGTVGMPLPGSTVQIICPNTREVLPIGSEGLVVVGGTQIMKGYLNSPDKTNAAIFERDNIRWYQTGDKGKIDNDGFLTIIDRYSRFAKIGGEMVSLAQVEENIMQLLQFKDEVIIAVNVNDDNKGEKIILLIELDEIKIKQSQYQNKQLRAQLIANKIAPLMLPSAIIGVAKIPMLGSGKIDFASAKEMAIKKLTN